MLILELFKILTEKGFIEFLTVFATISIPLVISIVIHEWAHGYAAYKFGDNTPKKQGRLTLNPLVHLDIAGTLMLFIVGIGWAKPVMINPENIPSRYKMALVGLAGPLSNFLMAVFFTVIFYFTVLGSNAVGISNLSMYEQMLFLIIRVNILLGIFNLIPIPPLDGANIIRNLLPEKIAEGYFKIAPYGLLILVIMLYTTGFGFIYKITNIVFYIIIFLIDLVVGPLIS